MNHLSLEILYEDNHCLAVYKPTRLLTAGDATGDETLLEQAKAYLKEKYHKPGKVYLGLVHRLDRPTSGVVLFARTTKAAARLSAQFHAGEVEKVYQAIVEGTSGPKAGELTDWLLKDKSKNLVRVVPPETAGAKQCYLEYQVLQERGGRRLLEVRPRTGRSHQIRVQLSSRGMPIVGDRKYGSQYKWGGKIGLHAGMLSFQHPTRGEKITLTVPTPLYFEELLSQSK